MILRHFTIVIVGIVFLSVYHTESDMRILEMIELLDIRPPINEKGMIP
jgi:hypothetical protein